MGIPRTRRGVVGTNTPRVITPAVILKGYKMLETDYNVYTVDGDWSAFGEGQVRLQLCIRNLTEVVEFPWEFPVENARRELGGALGPTIEQEVTGTFCLTALDAMCGCGPAGLDVLSLIVTRFVACCHGLSSGSKCNHLTRYSSCLLVIRKSNMRSTSVGPGSLCPTLGPHCRPKPPPFACGSD